MAQIACKGVTLGYEGKPVVRNLNFEVKKAGVSPIISEIKKNKTRMNRS